MSFECFQELANDLEKLYVTEKGYDVVIYAGENEDIKELHAHSNLLCTRSQYFSAAFSNEWAEKKDGKFIFKKPNIAPQFFKIILRFIYCGKIDLTQLQGFEVLKLLIVADELIIQSLIPRIQKYLIEHRDEFLQQNPLEILKTVYQHELFTDLWNCCLKSICEEPEKSFNSDELINLKAPLLELLLKRDDLNLDEAVIWNSLLKWGLAQNSSISQDITKWSKEETTIMEKTLHRFIPLIRFHHISPDDFLDKVYPLKEVLPKDLVNNLLTFHISPNRRTNIDITKPPRQPKFSVLIEFRHFAIFADWIDKKVYFHYRSIPYSFNLLYRASEDGYGNGTFHAKCDNKGATMTVAKIKGSDQIIGGYNSLYWDSSRSYKPTMGSFIFFFTSKNDFQSAKVNYGYEGKGSIGCYPQYGPMFGGNCDLYCGNPSTTWHRQSPYSYSIIDGMPTGKYNVDNYEVFQVIKK